MLRIRSDTTAGSADTTDTTNATDATDTTDTTDATDATWATNARRCTHHHGGRHRGPLYRSSSKHGMSPWS